MKLTSYFVPTLREVPADAVIASHRLMFRAGMIRRLANGLFAYLPLGLRVFRKAEAVIREEMNAAGALEIRPPVVVPGELWKESGRWEAMGDALLKAKNRVDADLVISPTAEEAVTALVRDELSSYRQLPLNLYQINTKYRDEVRPRYGVMRSREFTMKDGYSFHTSLESLDETYQAMARAYRRIFARLALTVIPVRADSGAMGGEGSEEFMVESDVGDNTLLLCRECDYAANVEKAACQQEGEVAATQSVAEPPLQPAQARSSATPSAGDTPATPPAKISTPHVRTIAELCEFLHTAPTAFIKTLIYRVESAHLPLVAVLIRGDLDVNETKLAAFLKTSEAALASDADVQAVTGAPVGFAGPVGLASVPLIIDPSVTAAGEWVCGANEADMHYTGVVFGRDFAAPADIASGRCLVADVRTVKAGDRCPLCGGELYEKKGNELGHIFKLGDKYTRALRVTCLDENGEAKTPIMGCYGIGVDRAIASVIEEHHDEAGIVWPVSCAPFHVELVPIKYEGAVKEAADGLEAALEAAGLEVLVDDRPERPGVKFNDADLIGIPYRVVIGDKGLSQTPPAVEVKRRGKKDARMVPLDSAPAELAALVREALAALAACRA